MEMEFMDWRLVLGVPRDVLSLFIADSRETSPEVNILFSIDSAWLSCFLPLHLNKLCNNIIPRSSSKEKRMLLE
jgi:hypothetical protein